MTITAITNKGQLLMQSLTNFFTTGAENIERFRRVTAPSSDVSLRVIDWFVTNYSREFDVSCKHKERRTLFSVHDAYKSQLKAYSKRQFDPFCRRTRINFYYVAGKKVVTTVGQLNFFRWAIDSGVLDYIDEHRAAIEKHMKTHVRRTRSNTSSVDTATVPIAATDAASDDEHSVAGTKTSTGKTKRKVSTVTARRTMCKHHVQMTVYFT